ncbi:hypothetical protein PAPYR_2700 [Paratrimastix pyriformis]|uniref:Uncharacterized protein n=1 Tax=Paratrimastix pyriformis TaxID=342808 RepID=A0ABQ8UQU0_9EUKA|nr:hypothetical protein PAPYR_2700 [Paratrimastix pyriformis]
MSDILCVEGICLEMWKISIIPKARRGRGKYSDDNQAVSAAIPFNEAFACVITTPLPAFYFCAFLLFYSSFVISAPTWCSSYENDVLCENTTAVAGDLDTVTWCYARNTRVEPYSLADVAEPRTAPPGSGDTFRHFCRGSLESGHCMDVTAAASVTARGSVVLVTGTAWGRLVLTDLDGGALMGELDACRHSRFRQVASCVVAGIQVVEVAGAAYLGVALGAPLPNASSTPGAANGTLTGQLPPVEDLLVFRLDAATANVTLTGWHMVDTAAEEVLAWELFLASADPRPWALADGASLPLRLLVATHTRGAPYASAQADLCHVRFYRMGAAGVPLAHTDWSIAGPLAGDRLLVHRFVQGGDPLPGTANRTVPACVGWARVRHLVALADGATVALRHYNPDDPAPSRQFGVGSVAALIPYSTAALGPDDDLGPIEQVRALGLCYALDQDAPGGLAGLRPMSQAMVLLLVRHNATKTNATLPASAWGTVAGGLNATGLLGSGSMAAFMASFASASAINATAGVNLTVDVADILRRSAAPQATGVSALVAVLPVELPATDFGCPFAWDYITPASFLLWSCQPIPLCPNDTNALLVNGTCQARPRGAVILDGRPAAIETRFKRPLARGRGAAAQGAEAESATMLRNELQHLVFVLGPDRTQLAILAIQERPCSPTVSGLLAAEVLNSLVLPGPAVGPLFGSPNGMHIFAPIRRRLWEVHAMERAAALCRLLAAQPDHFALRAYAPYSAQSPAPARLGYYDFVGALATCPPGFLCPSLHAQMQPSASIVLGKNTDFECHPSEGKLKGTSIGTNPGSNAIVSKAALSGRKHVSRRAN